MIVNSLSWRLGSVSNWSHVYFTNKKLYHILFYNNIYISNIIRKIFFKKFFSTSICGFSFIETKVFSFSNKINIFIFLNQSLKIKLFFFRKLIRFIGSPHKKPKNRRERRKLWYQKASQKKKIIFNRIFLKKLIRFFIFYFYYLPFFVKIRELALAKIRRLVHLKTKTSLYFLMQKSHYVELELIGSLIKNLFNRRRKLTYIIFLVRKILLAMKNRSEISGFKYLFAGRFTRRDRAVYRWEIISSLPLSSKTSSIEYLCIPVFLRYGSCSIHLWINR